MKNGYLIVLATLAAVGGAMVLGRFVMRHHHGCQFSPVSGGHIMREDIHDPRFAVPPSGEKHSDRVMMIEQMLDTPRAAKELGLTEEQTTLLKAKTFEMKKQQLELRHQAEMLALEQAQLMSEATPDEAKIMALVDKAGLVRTEESKLRISHMLLIKKTLTPEQHAALKKMIHRRAEQIQKQTNGGEAQNRQAWKGRGENEEQKMQKPPDREDDSDEPVPPPAR